MTECRNKYVDYSYKPTKLFKLIEDCQWNTEIDIASTKEYVNEAGTWIMKNDEGCKSLTWRCLPMHEACILEALLGVIKSLLSNFPNGIMLTDSYGRLPLHHACSNSSSKDVIEYLILAYQKSIEIKDM